MLSSPLDIDYQCILLLVSAGTIRRLYVLLAAPVGPRDTPVLGGACDTSFIRTHEFYGRVPLIGVSAPISFCLFYPAGHTRVQAPGYYFHILRYPDLGDFCTY